MPTIVLLAPSWGREVPRKHKAQQEVQPQRLRAARHLRSLPGPRSLPPRCLRTGVAESRKSAQGHAIWVKTLKGHSGCDIMRRCLAFGVCLDNRDPDGIPFPDTPTPPGELPTAEATL